MERRIDFWQTPRLLILAGVLSALAVGLVSRSADTGELVASRDNRGASWRDVLAAASSCGGDGAAILDALKTHTFQLSSKQEPGFSFEMMARAKRLGATREWMNTRHSYECRDDQTMKLDHGNGLPAAVCANDTVFQIDGRLPWRVYRDMRWQCRSSVESIEAWWGMESSPTESGGVVHVDFGAFFKDALSQDVRKTVWHRPTSTIRVTKNNGTDWVFRFRTPNDEERFGTAISHISYLPSYTTASSAWSTFIVGRESVLRFRTPGPEKLLESLGESVNAEYKPGRPGEVVVPEEADESLLLPLWYSLVDFPNSDPRPPERYQTLTRSMGQELLRICCRAIARVYRSDLRETAPDIAKTFPKLTEALATELRSAGFYVRKSLEGEVGSIGLDDPSLLWRGFEMQTSSRDALYVFIYTLWFAANSPLPEGTRYVLADALADLGVPCVDYIPWDRCEDVIATDPILGAICHSHWGWNCSDKERDACVGLLRDAANTTECDHVLVETLLRMDEIEKVPEEKLAAWFDSEIIRGDRDTRTESLRILSLTPNAQRYLMQRAEDHSGDASVRMAIVETLVYRAEATVRTKRFDFLSENDCQKILALKVPSAKSH